MVNKFSPALSDVVPLINWTYFFRAWRVPGRYEGIDTVCHCPACRAAWLQGFAEADRPRAEEALALFRDAQEMLRRFRDTPNVRIRAVTRLFAARSTGEDIIILEEDGRETPLPMLRQQRPSADGCCYSLADFVRPEGDRIGLFACTVQGADVLAHAFDREGDPYRALLAQTIADRLVEATSEWLHYQVRTRLWGYHPHEPFDPDALRRINLLATGGLTPDLTFLLDLPVALGLERAGIRNRREGTVISEGRFDSESLNFHERIRQGYLALAAEEPQRIAIIDAQQPADDILLQCLSATEEALRGRAE